MVFSYDDDGKKERTDIVGAVSREYDEGAKKSISEMDEAAMPLLEGANKVSREKNMEELVEALLW